MNSHSIPPPPYSNGATRHDGNYDQFQVARKPIQNTRPKTAGGTDRAGNAAGQWIAHSGPESMTDLELKQSRQQWESSRANLTLDNTTRNRTAEMRPSMADVMTAGDIRQSQFQSQSQLESTRPNLTVDTKSRPRPRTAETRPSIADTSMSGNFSLSPASSLSSFPPRTTISEGKSGSDASPSSSNMQKAFQEARHIAGGLISHPFESTKHYSVLRHSHGLVFYQGPDTTLAISIFADTPLPTDLTLWLQNKGWTGKTGMRVKALFGSNGSWLDVTPTMSIGAEQLKPTDERAWQRDITKFRKKAAGHKRASHTLRTTAIVRIPAEATDGYFQLVLCLGEKKKVLCTSPSFRVLSTSASPHSIRGASLLAMPLELGAMAVGVYAKNTAGRVAGPAVMIAQNRIQKYMPSGVTKAIAATAYSHSQVSDKVQSTARDVTAGFMRRREESYTMAGPAEIGIGFVDVGFDQGPKAPYPVRFVAATETTTRTEHSNLPALRLRGVSEDTAKKLRGYYFGWARFVTDNKKAEEIEGQDWIQVVISVLSIDPSQLIRACITEANKRIISVQFFQDSDDTPPVSNALEVNVLGFIRQDEPAQREALTKGLQSSDDAAMQAAIAIYMNDISTAQSFLVHPLWGPESNLLGNVSERSERPGGLGRMKWSFANAATAAQIQLDRVPLDKIGIRSPVDRIRDKSIVANGFWVMR